MKQFSAWTVTSGETPKSCATCGSTNIEQDTDTFDTWFSSGQWPFATLKASQPEDFKYFYPVSVMETGYDILPWWVCRMLMLGVHLTGSVPFATVYLHGLVRDSKGQKMSKSKGNVINPLDMIDTYGADALRMALVFGTGAGNDQALSEEKIRGMRNFTNKLWNAARYITLMESETGKTPAGDTKNKQSKDTEFTKELSRITRLVNSHMEKYQFNKASDLLYESFWHWFCDWAIEQTKFGSIKKSSLQKGLITYLKLLHPFMPFVTEEIWSKIPHEAPLPLIMSPWPDA